MRVCFSLSSDGVIDVRHIEAGSAQMVGKWPPQMIGIAGKRARMAFETAIAVRSCGPPMTLTPTASTCPPCQRAQCSRDEVAVDVAIDDRRCVYCHPGAAARLSTASGNRALRAPVIVGLISRTCLRLLMTVSAPARASG